MVRIKIRRSGLGEKGHMWESRAAGRERVGGERKKRAGRGGDKGEGERGRRNMRCRRVGDNRSVRGRRREWGAGGKREGAGDARVGG